MCICLLETLSKILLLFGFLACMGDSRPDIGKLIKGQDAFQRKERREEGAWNITKQDSLYTLKSLLGN